MKPVDWNMQVCVPVKRALSDEGRDKYDFSGIYGETGMKTISNTSTSSRLILYPAPEGAVGNSDYTVRVRQGQGEWRQLFSYNVKVDMHDVRNASMVYFDCAGAVEIEVTKNEGEIHDVAIRPHPWGLTVL